MFIISEKRVFTVRNMKQETQLEKKSPVLPVIGLMAGGLAVVLILLLTPWNLIPTQVTEDITVLAVTEHGCVGESLSGYSVVVEGCAADVGDIVSATFNVPAMAQNGYYDRIETKLAMVQP